MQGQRREEKVSERPKKLTICKQTVEGKFMGNEVFSKALDERQNKTIALHLKKSLLKKLMALCFALVIAKNKK